MRTFIQECDGVASLASLDNNLIPNYESTECLDAALAAGCLLEGQIVSVPSSNDGTPIEGDACRMYLNPAANGMVPVFSNTTNAFNTMKATDMTYTAATCTLNVTNLTATGCINGICYSCYAQKCDVSTAESCACGYTDTRETCIMDSVGTCIGCACSYALCCAECCGKCYFEACIDCCIQAYFDCYLKGNINTSNPGRDNSLWVN